MSLALAVGSVLTATLAVSLSSAGVGSDTPIYLTQERIGDGVRVQVRGLSDAVYEAAYSLEVRSGSSAGSNRTLNRGRVRLEPRKPVTLMAVTLGNLRSGSWEARLKVEPLDAPSYEEVQTSSGPLGQ